jgi:hypothetical protein
LVHLHTIGNSLGSEHRSTTNSISFPSGVVSLMDFLEQSISALYLLNQSIPRMMSMPFDFKTIRLATKSTPLI